LLYLVLKLLELVVLVELAVVAALAIIEFLRGDDP